MISLLAFLLPVHVSAINAPEINYVQTEEALSCDERRQNLLNALMTEGGMSWKTASDLVNRVFGDCVDGPQVPID